jgi:hypothetical protein
MLNFFLKLLGVIVPSSVMSPKIVKFNGKPYFECLWTGVKLSSRYGIPKKSGGEREGSYADAACAVAHLTKQFQEGEIKEKTLKEKLSYIHTDLGLHKSSRPEEVLVSAPVFEDSSNVDFSYRQSAPWMYQPHLHIPVEKEIEESLPKSKSSKKQCVILVPADGSEVQQFSLDKGQSLSLEGFVLKRLTSCSQKSKDMVVLSKDEGPVNTRLTSLFPAKEGQEQLEFKGDGIVICKMGEESSDIFADSPSKKRKSSKKSKEQASLEVEKFVDECKKQRVA